MVIAIDRFSKILKKYTDSQSYLKSPTKSPKHNTIQTTSEHALSVDKPTVRGAHKS